MKFPIIFQRDSKDCGPTCLKMIAEFYGKHLSLQELRKHSCIGKNGVSMLGICRAAKHFGINATGVRLSYDDLSSKTQLPCIVHWRQDHFVVVYRITDKNIYVADPARGRIKYKKTEFVDNWIFSENASSKKGVAVMLYPTDRFYEQEDESVSENNIGFILKYLLKYKMAFLQLAIGLLVGSIVLLIFPILTQKIVDIGIANKDIGFIWVILIAEFMLMFSNSSIIFIRKRILLHISARINYSMLSDFIEKLMRLPMFFFDVKNFGDLLQRIDDHHRIERFITVQSLNIIFSSFTFVIFGFVLIAYSYIIFLVFMSCSILYGFWICAFIKRRRLLDYEHFEQSARNRNLMYQLLAGMQEIKLQGCEKRKKTQWEKVQADLFQIDISALNLQQNQEAGHVLVNEIKNIIITVISATLVIYGEMTLGMMLAVQYIIGQLNSPIEQLTNLILSIQDIKISIERINEIHKQNDERQGRSKISTLSEHEINIENMCFRYNGSESYTLKDINMKISCGKVTAIVGESGSGKTTLVKLLLGYYTPESGSIKIGNIELEELDIDWWRGKCGAVLQDGYIFSDSLANNIAISGETIDKQQMLKAAEVSNIDKYIEQLPCRYDTIVGPEGQGLSQGQKQRILIARAVYKNPQFLFLDEATNSLDTKNEAEIVEKLGKFYTGKTVVIVAHRLSTVKRADNIIVLDKGEIVEQGTHTELLNRKGKYYELVKNQLELVKYE